MPPQTWSQAKQHNQPSTISISNNDNENASGFLFGPISAPNLRPFHPSETAKFLKARERYELEVKSKQSEIPSLKVLRNKASIDHPLLDNLAFIAKFGKIVPNIDAENS